MLGLDLLSRSEEVGPARCSAAGPPCRSPYPSSGAGSGLDGRAGRCYRPGRPAAPRASRARYSAAAGGGRRPGGAPTPSRWRGPGRAWSRVRQETLEEPEALDRVLRRDRHVGQIHHLARLPLPEELPEAPLGPMERVPSCWLRAPDQVRPRGHDPKEVTLPVGQRACCPGGTGWRGPPRAQPAASA